MTRHDEAEWQPRKRSLDEQLEGSSLFGLPAEPARSLDAPPSSLRVSRRTMTQDRAQDAAEQTYRGHAVRILAKLREVYPRGLTRDELSAVLDILLQSVCSCTNRLLKLEAPPLYEAGTRDGKNILYAYPSRTLTHEDSAQ